MQSIKHLLGQCRQDITRARDILHSLQDSLLYIYEKGPIVARRSSCDSIRITLRDSSCIAAVSYTEKNNGTYVFAHEITRSCGECQKPRAVTKTFADLEECIASAVDAVMGVTAGTNVDVTPAEAAKRAKVDVGVGVGVDTDLCAYNCAAADDLAVLAPADFQIRAEDSAYDREELIRYCLKMFHCMMQYSTLKYGLHSLRVQL